MRFKALDGWRGLCALAVALIHLEFAGHYYDISFVRNSYLFVDFFFVLSGFVITHSTWGRLQTSESLFDFVLKRFARLWPLHAAVIALMIPQEAVRAYLISIGYFSPKVAAFEGRFSIEAMWENLAFLNAVGLRDHITWNYPSWSIGAEFLTYLVFGVCVCFAARRLAVVAAGLSITGLLLVILVAADRPGPTIDVTYSFGFFRCLYGFFLGHLVYRAWKTTPCRLGSAGEVAVTLAVVAFVQFVGDGFSTILAPVVFAAAVWVFAAEGGVLTRALKTTPIQKLGLWSYGIYMTHTLVLLGLDKMIGFSEKRLNLDISYLETMSNIGKPLLLPLIGNAWVMDLLALIYLAAVVALGALAYRYVEVPGQAFILGLRGRRHSVTNGTLLRGVRR